MKHLYRSAFVLLLTAGVLSSPAVLLLIVRTLPLLWMKKSAWPSAGSPPAIRPLRMRLLASIKSTPTARCLMNTWWTTRLRSWSPCKITMTSIVSSLQRFLRVPPIFLIAMTSEAKPAWTWITPSLGLWKIPHLQPEILPSCISSRSAGKSAGCFSMSLFCARRA